LEEFNPQIKEGGERTGFGLEREGPRVPGAAISKLEQATRRGAFEETECIQKWEQQQDLKENGSGLPCDSSTILIFLALTPTGIYSKCCLLYLHLISHWKVHRPNVFQHLSSSIFSYNEEFGEVTFGVGNLWSSLPSDDFQSQVRQPLLHHFGFGSLLLVAVYLCV